MSANLTKLRKKALHQQADGFATMVGNIPLLNFAYDDYASMGNRSFVGSGSSLTGEVIIAYINADPFPISPVRANEWVVQRSNEAATMTIGADVLMFEPLEQHQRGVMTVPVPKTPIFSRPLKFRTADLPRPTPLIVAERIHED
jgi:hypothetical protein